MTFCRKKPNAVVAALGLISPDKSTVLREAGNYHGLFACLHMHSVALGNRCQLVLAAVRRRHHGTENRPCGFLPSVSLGKMGGCSNPFP